MFHPAERIRRLRSWHGVCALALVPWLLATAVELHRGHHVAGEQSLAAHGRAILSEARHAGESAHLDAASAPEVQDCFACLHRLQAGSAQLASVPGLFLPAITGGDRLEAAAPAIQQDPTAAPIRGPPAVVS